MNLKIYLSHALLATLFFAPALFAQESGAAQADPHFDRVVIESLDPDAWNGVVFMAKAFQQPLSFALRVGSRRGNFLDGEKIFNAVSEVGPHAPAASYWRASWRHPQHEAPVTLEWSRLDATTVVGRLNSTQGLQLVLETHFPNSTAGIHAILSS